MNSKTKIADILRNTSKTLFSIEILPPLKGHKIEEIYKAVDPLIEFSPSFINVTYHQEETVYKKHSSGLLEKKTVRKRPGTVALSAAIKYRYSNLIVVPHLICGGFSKEETENVLIDLHFLGMNNLLLVRGDPPKSRREFLPESGGHAHTLGLIHQIMNLNKGIYLDEELQNKEATDFSLGVAGYPEKHIEAANFESDLRYLKMKIDAGAEYIVTQMFFDNQKYFKFVEMCRNAGINVPIVPGLKPILTVKDLQVLPLIFNIDLPNDLVKEIEKCNTDEEASRVGAEWSIMQSKELIKFGVPSLHFFTIGKTESIRHIAKTVL
jgi:methylenetetrahydrofolate reductase (NADPH)